MKRSLRIGIYLGRIGLTGSESMRVGLGSCHPSQTSRHSPQSQSPQLPGNRNSKLVQHRPNMSLAASQWNNTDSARKNSQNKRLDEGACPQPSKFNLVRAYCLLPRKLPNVGPTSLASHCSSTWLPTVPAMEFAPGGRTPVLKLMQKFGHV